MKKWKQLVVFVMILTMVMGMTSFAAGKGGINTGVKYAGVRAATPTDPTPPEVKPPVEKPDPTKPDGEDQEKPGEDQEKPGEDQEKPDDNQEPESPVDTTVTGEINTDTVPTSTVGTKTALVGGKEVEVQLVVQKITDAIKDQAEVRRITQALTAQAAKLTGFKARPANKTFLFDVDLLANGSSVGTSLEQTVEVSINCSSLGLPSNTTKDNLRVLHYSFSKGTWEKRTILSYEKGVLTAEFDSFSPVALAYTDEAVPDVEKLTSTNDAWKLTSATQRNKYNVITLKWNKLGSKKDKYEIGFFNSPSDANPYKIISTKKTNYRFTKAVCGKEYFFKVRVKGSSTWSDACYGFTTLEGKGAPKITSVKTTYNTITIKWKKVAGAKGYAIYDSPSAVAPIATVKGTKVTFKNVTTGLSFAYYVRPIRENSIGDISAAATGMTSLQAVGKVSVKGLDSATVKVTWKKVKGATSYVVESWCDEHQTYEPLISESAAPVTRNTVIVTDLYANRTYKFRVTAVRNGSFSRSGEGQGKTKNVPR